jgi:hypothetical protein
LKQQKKRQFKAIEKALVKNAKENGRTNRDNSMNLFSAYYLSKFAGEKFVVLKKF